jgi:hypothetical protein
VECKPRCINSRRVSDPTRGFRPAFRVPGLSDDCYTSTRGAIVIGFGTPWSAGENFGCTLEHLGAPAIGLGATTTCLGGPGSYGVKSGCAGDKSRCAGDQSGCACDMAACAGNKSGWVGNKSGSTSNHHRAVWEKQHLVRECRWCVWKL